MMYRLSCFPRDSKIIQSVWAKIEAKTVVSLLFFRLDLWIFHYGILLIIMSLQFSSIVHLNNNMYDVYSITKYYDVNIYLLL